MDKTKKSLIVPICVVCGIVLFLVFGFIIGNIFFSQNTTTEITNIKEVASTIRLMKTEGEVSIQNPNGSDVSTQSQMKLYNGYQITTSSKSYAWLTFDEHKVVKVDANSIVEVQKKKEKITLYVVAGNLFFNVKEPLKSKEGFHVKTSTMTMGIRGTSGIVTAAKDGKSEIRLLTGKVHVYVEEAVHDSRTSYVLEPGQLLHCNALQDEKKAETIVVTMKEEDVPSFAVKEVVEDKQLQEKVEKESSLQFNDTASFNDTEQVQDTNTTINENITQEEQNDTTVVEDNVPSIIPSNPPIQNQNQTVNSSNNSNNSNNSSIPQNNVQLGTTSSEVEKEPTTESTTSKPVKEPTTEGTTSEPVKEPTTEGTTSKPVKEPTTESTTSEPAKEPTTEGTTSEPVKEPTTEGTTSEPVKEPTTEGTTSEPVKEPTTEGTTSEPVKEPTTEGTTSEPVKEPTIESTTSEPVKEPSEEERPNRPPWWDDFFEGWKDFWEQIIANNKEPR